MTADGRKLAGRHLAYLERDGVERDGSPGRLYGQDEKFSAEEFRERLPGEKRQFRFIVSPEDGARVHLAVDSGITSHAVASALGHESFKTTAESYAKREAVAGAQQKRALAVLTGGKLAS